MITRKRTKTSVSGKSESDLTSESQRHETEQIIRIENPKDLHDVDLIKPTEKCVRSDSPIISAAHCSYLPPKISIESLSAKGNELHALPSPPHKLTSGLAIVSS